MRSISIILFFFLVVSTSMAQKISTPVEIYGELFTDIQLQKIFPDSKTFVDCIPKREPAEIVTDYLLAKKNKTLKTDLKVFVEENFFVPHTPPTDFHTKEIDVIVHINNLWTVLRRKSDTSFKGGSLLPLPYEYIIPGGRFREIYYWDTYFNMLGLNESKQYDVMESMVQNFAYLINEYGHMPNGNRSYYLSRSQPPVFSLMLDLLANIKGEEQYVIYLPALQKEYNYWMDKTALTKHLVSLPGNVQLNRYWDQLSIPREESYLEDVTTAKNFTPAERKNIYRELRSAAESGWDFSSRWLADGKNLSSIQTTQIIPVDLNCLLYHIEITLSKAYAISGDKINSGAYQHAAAERKNAINKYCWSATQQWYMDYNIQTKKQTPAMTLAGMFPFFLRVADEQYFGGAQKTLGSKFLRAGGVVTTPEHTGQQWDAPNGWAPLQWVTVIGLENYGGKEMAAVVAKRWIALNKRVYEATGKMVEKYDVEHANKPGGGGEYPSQDGFGWTNGVFEALYSKYNPH